MVIEDEIWLIGSGPSARNANPPRHVGLACVNGSYELVDRVPSFYLVAEIPAGYVYLEKILQLRNAGCSVFVRPAVVRAMKDGGLYLPDDVIVVGNDFGPEHLRGLHKNKPLPIHDGYRPTAPWISSGVLMLWVLAELCKPRRIVVCGLDGYQVDPRLESKPAGQSIQGAEVIPGEYAEGVTPLASRPLRTPQWVEQMNARMAGAIKSVTNHYTSTEFVWLKRPHHWRESWRVKIGV